MAHLERCIFPATIIKKLVNKLRVWLSVFALEKYDLLNRFILINFLYAINDFLRVANAIITKYIHVNKGELLLENVDYSFFLKVVLSFALIFVTHLRKALVLKDVKSLRCLVDEENQPSLLIHYNHSLLQVIE